MPFGPFQPIPINFIDEITPWPSKDRRKMLIF